MVPRQSSSLSIASAVALSLASSMGATSSIRRSAGARVSNSRDGWRPEDESSFSSEDNTARIAAKSAAPTSPTRPSNASGPAAAAAVASLDATRASVAADLAQCSVRGVRRPARPIPSDVATIASRSLESTNVSSVRCAASTTASSFGCDSHATHSARAASHRTDPSRSSISAESTGMARVRTCGGSSPADEAPMSAAALRRTAASPSTASVPRTPTVLDARCRPSKSAANSNAYDTASEVDS